jgi:guanine nucleotide-binding protein subunit alpha
MEERAKAVSDGIDEELEKVRALEQKGPKPIKLLLLGVSRSILS